MCLIIFAHQVAPDYPLLVAANRDEFYARPTRSSGFWEEHPNLLAGKDLELGGTWMGLSRSGRFAAVTNYRDPGKTKPAPYSRGDLPLHFLTGQKQPQAYLEDLRSRADDYAGFNLLVGDRQSLWYLTNSTQEPPQQLQPGIYGLSNARLDTPWPKVTLGKTKLQQVIDKGKVSHGSLAKLVSASQPADARTLSELGQDSEMEQVLSAQFITTPKYGTRATTTLWTTAEGNAHWREQSFESGGKHGEEAELVLTFS